MYSGRVFADGRVDALADEIGVAELADAVLNEIDEGLTQARCSTVVPLASQPLFDAPNRRFYGQASRLIDHPLSQVAEVVGFVGRRRDPRPVRIMPPIPHVRARRTGDRRALREVEVLHVSERLERSTQGDR